MASGVPVCGAVCVTPTFTPASTWCWVAVNGFWRLEAGVRGVEAKCECRLEGADARGSLVSPHLQVAVASSHLGFIFLPATSRSSTEV